MPGLLLESPIGDTIRSATWRRRMWTGAIGRAGLPGPRPHDLRHTAASLAIASGASVKHVQRMLGHKDSAMTLNVYASLFEDDLDDLSERLEFLSNARTLTELKTLFANHYKVAERLGDKRAMAALIKAKDERKLEVAA